MVPRVTTETWNNPRTVKTKPVLILIAAAPSPLQDGLLALMTPSNQDSPYLWPKGLPWH
jgi:hypothetical protein